MDEDSEFCDEFKTKLVLYKYSSNTRRTEEITVSGLVYVRGQRLFIVIAL